MVVREGQPHILHLQDCQAAPVVLPVYTGSALTMQGVIIVPREDFVTRMEISEAVSP